MYAYVRLKSGYLTKIWQWPAIYKGGYSIVSYVSKLIAIEESFTVLCYMGRPCGSVQSKISHRSEVLQECMNRVSEDYLTTKQLLEYGLSRTSFK